MRITRVFNNNAVMAFNSENEEVILLGAGIGFYKKKGDIVDENKIDAVFTAKDNSKLVNLIQQIPATYIVLTEKIVKYAKNNQMIDLDDSVYLSLTDHIYFALQRIKEGIDLENPYLVDIKHFYKKEYQVGLYAKDVIYADLGVKIPEYEIGYITMHIIENSYEDRGTLKHTIDIIEDTLHYLKDNYLQEIEEDELPFQRLVTHVKFFAKRYTNRMDEYKTSSQEDNEIIYKAFKAEKEIVEKLSDFLQQKYGYPISNSEVNYLILHLRYCKNSKTTQS